VRAGGRGLEPGEQAGERFVQQGQLDRAFAHPALGHDHAVAEAGRLGRGGQAAGQHGQVPPGKDLRSHGQPEDGEPPQLFPPVGRHAEAPAPARLAQAALHRAAAALEQEPARGDRGGGQDRRDEQDSEEPGGIKRQLPAHRC